MTYQLIERDPELTEIIKLANKNLKIAIINIFKIQRKTWIYELGIEIIKNGCDKRLYTTEEKISKLSHGNRNYPT